MLICNPFVPFLLKYSYIYRDVADFSSLGVIESQLLQNKLIKELSMQQLLQQENFFGFQ